MSQQFDVIVVGAGMVGASAALSLARKGFAVALVERQKLALPLWQATDEIDLRVSAISPASQALLTDLGVWAEINKQRACDYYHMSVWHENGAAQMNFSCEQVGAALLGSIVENNLLQSMLLQQLTLMANVTLLDGHTVQSMQQADEQVTLQVGDGETLQAKLLIAADGRQSTVRELLHLSASSGSYRQTAIVANVTTEKAHEFTAWQRFLATGPVALLPLANGMSSIVWSADTELADELLGLADEDFMQRLGEATEFRLGQITSTSRRAGFPLSWHITRQWLDRRVLFIGDAAHGVHPLAGQGVNLGFGDVALLSQIIKPGQDIYQHRQLRRFERQRKAESATATHLFSALKLLYGQQNRLLCMARDAGMSAVESSSLIKRLVIQSAMHNMS